MRRGAPTLVSCCDRGYLPHLATLIRSVALAPAKVGLWHVLCDASISVADRAILQSFAEENDVPVELHRVSDDILGGFPSELHYPALVWQRALLGDVLPGEDRALYLDCDTLVLHDLNALWEVGLGDDSLFGAVTHPAYGSFNSGVDRLGMLPGARYFNSGVMLLDLERMRANGVTGTIRAFVTNPNRPPLLYPEQDALNLLFPGRWTPLDPSWNAMTAIVMPFVEGATWADDSHHDAYTLERAARSPGIVHFESAPQLKPWHIRCFNPYAGLYRRLRATTPWPLTRLDGRRVDAAIARLPVRRQLSAWMLECKLAAAWARLGDVAQ